MEIQEILKEAIKSGASDFFIVAGKVLSYKINGQIESANSQRLSAEDTRELIRRIYELAHRATVKLEEEGDDDFSFALNQVGRFRINAYKQRGSWAAVVRVVRFNLPKEDELHIPEHIMELCQEKKGLVLVTGPAGSGKSTTLACMIHRMNTTRSGHLITLEDPIEFVHTHQESIVSQREVGEDTASYIQGLRAALRESPDAILLGEMRDLDTIQTAMTAAETGQLILSTLHTLGAANTINRIIDVFPPGQQHQIRIQLAMVLRAVISQQLVQTKEGTLRPVFEVMHVTQAIQNLIRESKMHQIDAMLQMSQHEGMQTMDMSLIELYQQGIIEKQEVMRHAMNGDVISKYLK